MDSSSADDVLHDFFPFFRVYKDGRVEKFYQTSLVPPSDTEDPNTGVRSKDVVVSSDPKVSARIFLPKIIDPDRKLPLLVYIHGGAFTIESAFSAQYHNYVNALVSESNVIAVSVEYRLAPEHLIPACYDDSWAVMQWVASHGGQAGPEPWLNDHADLGRIFLAGDSAGANIAHYMTVRATVEGLGDGTAKIIGIILVHSYFDHNKPSGLWTFLCKEGSGIDDIRLNPSAHPSVLSKLACERVLIVTAEKDMLRDRGQTYREALKKSDWGGVVEFFETEGEDHVFHLLNPACEKAGELLKLVAAFINRED